MLRKKDYKMKKEWNNSELANKIQRNVTRTGSEEKGAQRLCPGEQVLEALLLAPASRECVWLDPGGSTCRDTNTLSF